MPRLFFYFTVLAFLFSSAGTVHSQDVATLQPIPIHQHHKHTHTGELFDLCISMDLWNQPESQDALKEFRAWNAKGRPGQTELMSNTLSAEIGTRRNFFVNDFVTSNYVSLPFELRGKGETTFIWVEVAEIGNDKVSDSRVATLLDFMENRTNTGSINPEDGIIANNRTVFGNAPNVDGSGTVQILITNIRSEEGSFNIGGYFAPINLSTTNPNSNRADIIYINSVTVYPNRSIQNAAGILAHEDQHLIHANYGTLATFLNEGQSEYAEIVNGFPGRFASHLSDPEQINIHLYQWRGSSVETLFDYSRASLFHDYIASRIGTERTGNITSSLLNRGAAYSSVLQGTGILFPDLLMDFHTANVVNNSDLLDGRFGYTNTSRAGTRATGFSQQYQPVQIEADGRSGVQYGGSDLKFWAGVRDFRIDLSSHSDLRHRLVAKRLFSPNLEIVDANVGVTQLQGDYESVVLISAKTAFSSGSETASPATFYEYSSSWDPLPVVMTTFQYHQQAAFFAELPGDPDDPNRSLYRKYSTRLSPRTSGDLSQLSFTTNTRADAVRGSGILRISLHESVNDGVDAPSGLPRLIPGEMLFFEDVPIAKVNRGRNVVSLDGKGWALQASREYHIVFEVINHTRDARIEFLIDAGSTSTSSPDYYPIRSRLFLAGTANRWQSWRDSNNFLLSASMTGMYEGPLDSPVFFRAPEQRYVGILGQNLEITVGALGTPLPIYIWKKDGRTIQGQNGPNLRLERLTSDDTGVYEVRASNYAGFTDFQQFRVEAIPAGIILSNNYPNPFNTGTTLEFSISEPGMVALEVFDILGRKVQRLTGNQTYPPGLYSIPFDGTQLGSGVYLYRMSFVPESSRSESVTHTGKMMLLK
jgi:hypothetical protein